MYLQPVRQPCMHPILPGQPSTVLRTWIVAQGRTGAKKRGRCCGQPKSRRVTTIGPGGLLEPILGYFLVFWGGPQNPQSGLEPDSSTFVDSNPGSHIGSGARRAHGTRGKPGAPPCQRQRKFRRTRGVTFGPSYQPSILLLTM